jgi:hypothetical protein
VFGHETATGFALVCGEHRLSLCDAWQHACPPVLSSSLPAIRRLPGHSHSFTSIQVESSPCRSRRIRHDVICHPTGIPTSLDYNRPQPLVTSTSRTTKTHQPCANHRKLNYRHAPITSLQTPINSAAVFKHPRHTTWVSCLAAMPPGPAQAKQSFACSMRCELGALRRRCTNTRPMRLSRPSRTPGALCLLGVLVLRPRYTYHPPRIAAA